LEEVAEHAGRKALMEVDDNSALIVGNMRGILGQQLSPRPIFLLNTVLIIMITQLKTY
jgi:hypothetical protein